ncbi:hypothetical protein AK812_SmicGene24791 [Symbiodinium microadriaticum]|uniref:Uncharacterized protein n=1 Tax=Symbiodinium microadriaticum TaxID=2951 RepID=A0A1Q9DE50_SYMMI|nr:hypothetical protein AK812_SmicGene24791 [Symbiodinium microadriaticum]
MPQSLIAKNDFDVGTVIQNLRLLRAALRETSDGTMTEYGPAPANPQNVPMTTSLEPIRQVPPVTDGGEQRQAQRLQRSTQVRGANIRGFHQTPQTEVRHSRRRTVGRTRRLTCCCDDD